MINTDLERLHIIFPFLSMNLGLSPIPRALSSENEK